MLLAVNFHYIQPYAENPYGGIYPTTTEELERQLGEIGQYFEFISGKDLINAVTDSPSLPSRACLITFDDGLKEQYVNAVPVLKKLRIPAVFFINTLPFADKRALTVHKTHWLRSTRSSQTFLEQVLETAGSIGITLDFDKVDDEAASRQYLYDDLKTRRVKFLLNHILSTADYNRLIHEMFAREVDEIDFCNRMYMNRRQIVDLSRQYTVGSHTHSHHPPSSLSIDALRSDFEVSKTILKQISGLDILLVSYPYGGPTAVSWDVANMARITGYIAGFTMERSMNRSLDESLLLARLSTNDAPGGKSALLSFEGTRCVCTAPMTLYRTVHFKEKPVADF